MTELYVSLIFNLLLVVVCLFLIFAVRREREVSKKRLADYNRSVFHRSRDHDRLYEEYKTWKSYAMELEAKVDDGTSVEEAIESIRRAARHEDDPS